MSEGVQVHVTEIDIDRVNKVLAHIHKGSISAAHNAMKRAAAKAKTEAGRFAAMRYTITKADFANRTDFKVLTKNGAGDGVLSVASVSVMFAGNVIPLISFETKAASDGVHTVVKRGEGGTIHHAFFVESRGMHLYERATRETPRYPIQRLYGPSTAHMMEDDQVQEHMDQLIVDAFDKRIDHEIERILNGWGWNE